MGSQRLTAGATAWPALGDTAKRGYDNIREGTSTGRQELKMPQAYIIIFDDIIVGLL
jgi:hypothetical protein